jgi:HEPN domain-containing protein
MSPEYSPDDPKEWLRRAHSNLVIARSSPAGAYFEDLCFEAQQAAEKAIKALLIARGVDFAYIHDLARLLTALEEAGQSIPGAVKEAARLTRFAVFTRYPGVARPVSRREYEQALAIAEEVVRWAESVIGPDDQ